VSLPAIRSALQHYADRGAFRSFSEVGTRGRKTSFQFVWFRDVKFTVTFDEATRVLTFIDVLPGVPARSPMDAAFRKFIASRSLTNVPEHRRVDLKKMGVRIVNKGGAISLVFNLKPRLVEYGVKKAVHLVHEVLMDFLNDSAYVEYQIAHFNLNPELA
jgi:hypothetical protein